jgi:hypothetical protein
MDRGPQHWEVAGDRKRRRIIKDAVCMIFILIYHAESQDNYDEDFNSSVSVSPKEDIPNQGTDTEIEEELGSGVEDLLSSNSAVSSH